MNTIKDDIKTETSDVLENKVVIKMAADVLQSLSKAIKALQLYPENSPVRQRFITDLTGKFTNFLQEYGDLTLTVKPFDLLYQGEVVYSQQAKEDSIAFKFFCNGIRELAFSENLDEQELLDFIDVIQGNREQDEDDDIVTLMWKKEFKNIRYMVIDEGWETDGGLETKHPSENSSGYIRSTDALRNAHKSESRQGQINSGALHLSEGIEHEIEQIYGKPFSEIFVLTSEEIEKVKEEMESEAKSNLMLELLDILFLILEIEEDTESYVEIMSYIENAIKSKILTGDYARTSEFLNRIKKISENEKEISPKHAETARGLIDALGDEAFLQELTQSLNASKTDNIDEIYSILAMLNKNSILPMINMLSDLEQIKSRRVVCDALAVLAKDNLESVLIKLQDENWYIVRNILYVLGRVGDARVLNHIKRIKDHIEPKVRKEIIHTLTEIKSDEAKKMIVSYLNDTDNTVRVSALKRISSMEHRKAVPDILQIISSDGFDSKENYEKKEFFEALAILGTKDQLPYLKELLMKRSRLFGRAKVDELRILSVHALRKMTIPGAIDIIREGASSSDKVIRKICEDALRDSGKGNI
ncbi:MAG TPA: HEAT repeat domain-containing protein [Nitrospirota bacterium]|nr:HEAT repeat domain-containing protein [Nitrospirota bacterium]